MDHKLYSIGDVARVLNVPTNTGFNMPTAATRCHRQSLLADGDFIGGATSQNSEDCSALT